MDNFLPLMNQFTGVKSPLLIQCKPQNKPEHEDSFVCHFYASKNAFFFYFKFVSQDIPD